MCDTIVATPPATADGAVFLGKNSDREPGEAQFVEHVPGQDHLPGATLRCTWVEVPQARRTHAVLLSRPFWMWGAEMGVNEHGVAIGNEAVFTRLRVPEVGLTGMDLVRLALERAHTAEEALEVICAHLERFGGGGRAGYRHAKFRYDNAFAIADAHEAWVLETAGQHWVAKRVRGVYTLSNALTVGEHYDRISDGAIAFAQKKGWHKRGARFDFAKSFSDPAYRVLTGAKIRRACTLDTLRRAKGTLGRKHFFAALRSHNDHRPSEGWRMQMPCAHASWQPTRQSGQTTASMVCRLDSGENEHWFTGTSSPCMSIFKPVVFGERPMDLGPQPGAGYDPDSLFWRHERLHRLVLADYERLRGIFEDERETLQQGILATGHSAEASQHAFAAHREAILRWVERVERASEERRAPTPFGWFWKYHAMMDQT
ncbi:peptidase U34 [Persicimonas caeni]|uniref:Dipeptidase n=1 Tax=Persicimonas caeni TaxID=2292766 RepID=A0A4Y6PWH5_PERCE|nr:C69 family dipeptidase [Persicimonas caeni]QDG52678.1 peptidase U34 [Persicimonas caeni]QED33900.1 peptidase U34 [Persicimonas caeni]